MVTDANYWYPRMFYNRMQAKFELNRRYGVVFATYMRTFGYPYNPYKNLNRIRDILYHLSRQG